jgi:aryl-alcohol dehydrogenase-like predicted oxidoreductase
MLGTTAMEIPALGIGTWPWGQTFLWNYGVKYGEAELREAYRAALDAGLTFFDTAEVYGMGESERLLGAFVAETPARPVIATKFNPLLPIRLRKGALLGALRRSLDRLQLDAVDLYQIHTPYSLAPMSTWLSALADVVEAGLVRAVGVSNFSALQMVHAHAELGKRGVALASNQVHYSLLHRAPERNGVLEVCRDLGITLIAYMPLAHGLLTGKYTPEQPPSGLRGLLYRRKALTAIQPLLAAMRRIAATHGSRTPAQVALNWTIRKGVMPIVGVKTAAQVAENAGALGWRLTDDEQVELDDLSKETQRTVKTWW